MSFTQRRKEVPGFFASSFAPLRATKLRALVIQ